jgi:hypothetical protein
MKKRLLVLVILMLIMIPAAVQAQDDIRLSYLQIDLWPEYDRPEMLVIYRAQLAGDVTLPADVTFRIPAAAGAPNAVAVKQPDGNLLNAMFEQQDDGLWAYITVTATAPEIQLEYYDPQIEFSGSERQFEFSWLGDIDVEFMLIQVQQPVGASSMSIEPDLGEFTPGSDGLQYYTMEVGAPSAGDTVTVKMNYQKESDALSAEAFQVQPSAPITGDSQARTQVNLMSLLPWLLGAFGVLLVGGGIFWYWRSGQDAPAPKTKSRGQRSSVSSQANPEGGSNSDIYCHQCGKRAASGDRFCRTCGGRLKKG